MHTVAGSANVTGKMEKFTEDVAVSRMLTHTQTAHLSQCSHTHSNDVMHLQEALTGAQYNNAETLYPG